jgi:hypothetical protein
MSPSQMEEITPRSHRLLEIEVPTIFLSGGCHVFANCLVKTHGYRLLSIQGDGCDFFHVACAPKNEADVVIDALGWFTHLAFRRRIEKPVTIQAITEYELRHRFTETDGPGLYSHSSFVERCMLLAENWIQEHKAYFDGSTPKPIPDIPKTWSTSPKELFGS